MVSALHLLQLAQTAAERAASYIRSVERPPDPRGWTLKGARDFVTEVDRTAGRFDGFWEQHLSAWDIAAGSLLIREAGGIVTDFSGRNIGIEHTGVVAGNRALHGWLLDTLAGV